MGIRGMHSSLVIFCHFTSINIPRTHQIIQSNTFTAQHIYHTNNFKMYVCVHDNVAKLLGRFEKFFLQMVGMVQDSVRKIKNFKKNFFSKILNFYFFIFLFFLFFFIFWKIVFFWHYPGPYLPSAKRIFKIGPAVWPH